MREILYHRHAVRYLKRMPEDRKDQVKLRVGGYRLIFRVAENIEVLHVGPRGDIY